MKLHGSILVSALVLGLSAGIGGAALADQYSGTTSSGRSAGQTLDDATITSKVKTALLADPEVKGLKIDVDTRKGEVTLSGTVDSQRQVDRATEIATATEGVRKVSTRLDIERN